MKIKFTKLPTNDGTIKVSLDGGQSFTDYNIADIHESGIPLEDSQDYEKTQIQAPANVLKNLNVVSGVKVESTEGGGAGSTNESFLIMDTDTYGPNFPYFVTGINLPNCITTIGHTNFFDTVFKTFPNLQSIVIPESVTSIGENAFQGCSSLTSITIPESVTSIGVSAFYGCKGLISITIPEGVTTIGNYAFYNCSSLTSVTIPSSVTSISASAFNSCTGLTSMTIPESVTSIGENAFRNCTNLKTINYTGTKEQWKAIIKGSYWQYGAPLNVIYNYKPE